jgi:rhodanese-related sulfurtransferase
MTQIRTIDAEEAIDYLSNNDYYLLDVRSAEEFDSGHLDAAINIPVLEMHLRAHEIPLDKEIVVYCAHGVRSGKAAHYLLGSGFHKVSHISGGIEAMNL